MTGDFVAILGIGAGKFELTLDKAEYHPRDVVQGKAVLKLNENIKARGVIATIEATRTRNSGKHTYTDTLFHDERKLDGEKEYFSTRGLMEYSFQFTIPTGVISEAAFNPGIIGGVMGFFRDSVKNSRKWVVSIKLDMAMAFDVSATKSIRVTPGSPNAFVSAQVQGTTQPNPTQTQSNPAVSTPDQPWQPMK